MDVSLSSVCRSSGTQPSNMATAQTEEEEKSPSLSFFPLSSPCCFNTNIVPWEGA